jgi:cell division septum initiation protein DivIVA
MTRQESANPGMTDNNTIVPQKAVDFDIQQQLAELQELLYDSFHIPLTAWSVVDEEKILDQIDVIAEFIPGAVQRAIAILEQEALIIQNAELEAQRIRELAQQEALRIQDESGIIQRVQQEAEQYRLQVQQECDSLQRQVQQECDTLQRQVQQECDTLQRQTLSELEQIKQVTHQELQQFRQQTNRECSEIQRDADQYADTVLGRLEGNLAEMMRIVSQSRQILYDNSPQHNPAITHHTPKAVPPASPPVGKPRPDRPRRRSR